MIIKPRKNRILLKYLDQETQTKEGIIIPDTAKQTDIAGFVNRGEITAIGPDVSAKDFKIGDRVIFKKTEALHIKLGGKDTREGKEEKYLLVEDKFITCKLI